MPSVDMGYVDVEGHVHTEMFWLVRVEWWYNGSRVVVLVLMMNHDPDGRQCRNGALIGS